MQQAKATRRLPGWTGRALVGVLILGLGWLALVNWVRAKRMETSDVPLAIYDTASLLEAFHDMKQTDGAWPPPGLLHAHKASFVESFDDNGKRVDVYDYGHGQRAHFIFDRNSILVLPVRGEATTLPSGDSPGGSPAGGARR